MKRAKAPGWSDLDSLAEEFLGIKAQKKEVETQYNSVKSIIVNRLDGAASAETDNYTITYSNNEREIIDTARLKTERPDLYLKYLKKSDSWTLNVREKVAKAS